MEGEENGTLVLDLGGCRAEARTAETYSAEPCILR